MEHILCAAIKLRMSSDDADFVIIAGHRHSDCFHTITKLCRNQYINQSDQGFLTSTGRFVDRITAKEIAYGSNQLIRNSVFSELTSEDLY